MRGTSVFLLFVFTLFLSAFLLFCVQPMIAKMVLPLLGGSPAVWSTCMVFFQAALLAGYAYAHATTPGWGCAARRSCTPGCCCFRSSCALRHSPRRGAVAVSGSESDRWLLGLLLALVGSAVFHGRDVRPALAAVVRHSGHPAAADPYFLYGASNLGSMLALLAYPLVVEPNLRLAQQSGLGRGLWSLRRADAGLRDRRSGRVEQDGPRHPTTSMPAPRAVTPCGSARCCTGWSWHSSRRA